MPEKIWACLSEDQKQQFWIGKEPNALSKILFTCTKYIRKDLTEWREISTAPKDRQILLYDKDSYPCVAQGFWEGSWVMYSEDGFKSSCDPTHYMILPEPPEGE